MVKRATQAMLDFIHDCRAVKWTFASAAPSPKVMFSDPKVGLFSQSLLLPDFENGTAIAAALLATQKAEWRKPLGPWNTRTDKEEDEDEETGERQPDAGEDAGARAGEGAGETADMEGSSRADGAVSVAGARALVRVLSRRAPLGCGADGARARDGGAAARVACCDTPLHASPVIKQQRQPPLSAAAAARRAGTRRRTGARTPRARVR